MRRGLTVLCLVLLATVATAAPKDALQGAPAALVRSVEAATGGRVLAAEPVERDGVPGIRFRVLTPDGKVRHVWRPLPGAQEGR